MSPARFTLLGLLALGVAFCGACAQLGATAADASAEKTLIPAAAWDCGMPAGIPKPETGTLVLEAEVKLDAIYDVGQTPYGRRQAVVTQTGKMTGSKIQADILPGSLDYQLILANGVVEVEQILGLHTSDNRTVIMRNAGTGPNGNDLRVVYDFEASTTGTFAWLNTGKYVGRRTIDAATKTMHLSIYEVSAVLAAGALGTVNITKPAGVPAQPWDYRHAATTEQKGDLILTESVKLGSFQPVQGGKRGNRNVIPITGGTLTGMVAGKILFGGADYQSSGVGGGPPIDARYLWQTTEGEIIIVRNTTNPGIGLVPSFETRVDGKYAWFNSGKYLSSDPGFGAGGGLGLTMYKSK